MEGTILSLISEAEKGDSAATDALFSALYAELHRLAKRELARHGAASLSVTTLLHEAYLDISARSGASFPDRARFLTYAARAMRGLIIDHARSRHAIKRGGEFEITALENHDVGNPADAGELSAIGEALDELARMGAGAGGTGGFEILLRADFPRDRRPAQPVGTHRPEEVGEGAHLPSPPHARRHEIASDVQPELRTMAGAQPLSG